jgi:HD-like signal output (HDOD) protein/CheY-like chemotaxis protein
MQGILARGEHRFAAVATPAEAWTFLRHNPGVDLLFTGLQLEGAGNGLALVQRLKGDPFLKHLPVVVYTGHGDRSSVKSAIDLQVQNFLVKPYHDDDIFAEIAKAEANPWRQQFFEEEKSFCRLMGYTPEILRQKLVGTRDRLAAARPALTKAAELQDHRLIAGTLSPVRQQAEEAGAWVVVEAIDRLLAHSAEDRWSAWPGDVELLDYAGRLLAGWLDREQAASPDFYDSGERCLPAEVAERRAWLAAPAAGRCPVLTPEQLHREITALRGCPVIDSAAAAFQMMANGHPSCINPLMDLVARDPGLSAQMLIAANLAHPPKPGDNPIEDARLAVGQLGELRLQQLARSLPVAEERIFNLPPDFDWPRYWTFQRGVARIAQITCRELEFYSLEPVARTAGQLHDIGKLVLAHLHPAGFQAILEHARVNRVRLHEAEKLYLGCTTCELGARFAEHAGLPRRFIHVIRGIDDPAAATEERNLVAIISLARKLCRHNLVGASGDPPLATAHPLRQTAQWQILSETIYPSFNLEKFEQKIHAQCALLRAEFSGHEAGTVGEIVTRGAGA